MLWEQKTDAHNVVVSAAMRPDRFETIFSNLHVSDNANLDTMDKFSKLRPLTSKLNDRCIKVVPNDISASLNPGFFILVVMGANNIFGESPFGFAIRFGVVQQIWATFAGFSRIRVQSQILNMRNTVSVHQLSSLVGHLQRHTLDNTILYSITFSPVLHFLISSVQWDIRQQVQ
jgi:hypothetical protein